MQPISSAWRPLAFLPVTLSHTCPVTTAEPNKKKKVSSSVLATTQSMKSQTLFKRKFLATPHSIWGLSYHKKGSDPNIFWGTEAPNLSCVQLFVTPWTLTCQAPLSMEFSRSEYYSGQPFPSPGHLPNPGIKPRSPALQVDSLYSESPGKPKNTGVGILALLQRVFLTQESNLGLLYCRWILYQLSYQGSPQYLLYSMCYVLSIQKILCFVSHNMNYITILYFNYISIYNRKMEIAIKSISRKLLHKVI